MIREHEERCKVFIEIRHDAHEIDKLKYEILLLKQKHTDDLLHVLMDLVYFNTDIPQNHTIRKPMKKSDVIECRDNELWNPMPTNTVVQTILNPICKLAQRMINDTDITYFSPKDYSKQNFNDIIYSKTQRGNLKEQRILQPYESPPMETSSSNWQAFQDDILNTYDPVCGLNRSTLIITKQSILDSLKQLAEDHGIKHFCCYRDGEPIFNKICERFPE